MQRPFDNKHRLSTKGMVGFRHGAPGTPRCLARGLQNTGAPALVPGCLFFAGKVIEGSKDSDGSNIMFWPGESRGRTLSPELADLPGRRASRWEGSRYLSTHWSELPWQRHWLQGDASLSLRADRRKPLPERQSFLIPAVLGEAAGGRRCIQRAIPHRVPSGHGSGHERQQPLGRARTLRRSDVSASASEDEIQFCSRCRAISPALHCGD